MLKNNHRGRYNNDYSPKYGDPYDIYEKAKEHAKKIRHEDDQKDRRKVDEKAVAKEHKWKIRIGRKKKA